MYSLHTANCVLLLAGHTADVTAVLCHPRNALQAYSTSLDGTVRLWDLYSGTCIRSWAVGQPILSAVISRNFSAAAVLNATASAASLQAGQDTLYLNCNPRTTSSSTSHTHATPLIQRSCRVYAFHLPTATRTLLYKARHCTALALSPAQDYLASIAKHTLILYSLRSTQKCRFQHNNNLTSLAFHPRDSYVVTGDATGKIILWHQCFPFPSTSTTAGTSAAGAVVAAQPVCSILHWHSHAVAATAFTHDGAYLLSGGEEGVMVAWQMETGHKQFIPRLLSSIRSIVVSADNLHYALMHADNAVRIVSAVSSRVSRSIQGMEIGERRRKREGEERVQPVLVAAEAAGGVLMGGRSGYVQVWDVWTDVHVCDVDVTERNYVSRMDETLLHLYRVEHVAVTSDWLLTVERRTDAELRHKQALKFFRHSSQAAAATATTAAPGSPYILNTRIDQPHKQSITATAFHPTLPIAVTAAADRTFKVWQTTATDTKSSNKATDKTNWFCAAEGFYRDFPIHAASFSRDGLLAVSYGQLITVWSLRSSGGGGVVDGLELRRVLVHGSPMLAVLHMCWLGEGGRLATASADSVSVWDVRTGQCEWSWRLKATSMCCDERGLMALCVSSTKPMDDNDDDVQDKDNEQVEEKEEKEEKEMKEVQPDDIEAAKKHQARGLFDSQLSHLLLFQPHSSTPFRVWRLDDLRLHRYQQSTVLFTSTACFVRAPSQLQHTSSSLLYLNKRKQLVRLDDVESDRYEQPNELQTATSQPNTSLLSAAITTPVSLFERMYGKAALLPPPTSSVVAQQQQSAAVEVVGGEGGRGRRFEALFGAASHALPAMSTLFTPFIQSVLHQQSPHSQQQQQAEQQQQQSVDVDADRPKEAQRMDAASDAGKRSRVSEDEEILRAGVDSNPFSGLVALMATEADSSDQPMDDELPPTAATQPVPADQEERQRQSGVSDKKGRPKSAHKANGIHHAAEKQQNEEKTDDTATLSAKAMNGHAKLNGRVQTRRGEVDEENEEDEKEEEEELHQNGVMEDEVAPAKTVQSGRGRRKTLPVNGGGDNGAADGKKAVRRSSMAVSKSKRTKA